MNLNKFNDKYSNIITKNFKRKEKYFLLGDFNVGLLNCDKHAGTNEFLDTFPPHMFLLRVQLKGS